jgi:hypothetical protein
MNFVIGLILLFLLLSAIEQFARADAAAMARAVRQGGGVSGPPRGGARRHGGELRGWRAFGPAWTSFRTGDGRRTRQARTRHDPPVRHDRNAPRAGLGLL